jgi:hypothetical protein
MCHKLQIGLILTVETKPRYSILALLRRAKMHKNVQIAVMFCALLGAAQWSRANILELQFAGPASAVSLNGGATESVDLTVDLFANTANLMTGTGFAGSDVYSDLTPYVSSTDLGLSDVAATAPLSVEIGTPNLGAPFKDDTILLDNGKVLNGLFGLTPSITSWNRTSPFGPSHGLNVSTGSLVIDLANGDTLTIGNFDNVAPFGRATFQAIAVPEPGTTGVASAILAGIALMVRRRARA